MSNKLFRSYLVSGVRALAQVAVPVANSISGPGQKI